MGNNPVAVSIMLLAAFLAGYTLNSIKVSINMRNAVKSASLLLVNDMEKGIIKLKESRRFGRILTEPITLLDDWKAAFEKVSGRLGRPESDYIVNYYTGLAELAYYQQEAEKEIESLKSKGIKDLRSFHDIYLDRVRGKFLDAVERILSANMDEAVKKLGQISRSA